MARQNASAYKRELARLQGLAEQATAKYEGLWRAYLGMKLKAHLANVGVDAADMDMDFNSRT